jgi:uncharacterized protein (TIGR02996 family)
VRCPLTDRAALLSNVLNAPADDTARLVLADWLEENEEAFGCFIRAGVLASRFRQVELVEDREYYDAVRTLAEVATAGEPARWLSALGIGPSTLSGSDWMWDQEGDRVTVRIGTTIGVFLRGLLAELRLPFELSGNRAVTALAAWPLERVTVTDISGLSFSVDAPDERPVWRLSAAFTIPPRRRLGAARRRLNILLGENDVSFPPGRWTAERSFPDRAKLVQSVPDVWPALLAEVRDAAGAQGVAVSGPG